MKKIFYLLICLIFSVAQAQQYIIGKVTTDVGIKVSGVIVFNVRTGEQMFTDKEGHFLIKALATDELRFIKQKFDRTSVKVKPEDFFKPLSISIQLMPQAIEEIEIAIKPTGNLKKDVKVLDRPKKVVELNERLAVSMRIPPATAYPSNQMPSTIVMGPNFSAGQVTLLSTGGAGSVLGMLTDVVRKKTSAPKTTPTYAETQNFYRRVKESINMQYFYNHGLDDYQFERLLAYTDDLYKLTKNFRYNFNKITIESYLKSALKDFLKTKMNVSKSQL